MGYFFSNIHTFLVTIELQKFPILTVNFDFLYDWKNRGICILERKYNFF